VNKVPAGLFQVIERVREEMPAAYLKVVASVIPREVNVKADPFEHLSDEEIAAAIALLQRQIVEEAQRQRSDAEEPFP
jgi:hypothetical protein